MDVEFDPKGLAAARRLARWEIGSAGWADHIVRAYLDPDWANAFLDDEEEE